MVLDQSTVLFQKGEGYYNLCGFRSKHTNISKWGGVITICVVLDRNGGNVMSYSSSQNSHFEKLKVDFNDKLVANLQRVVPSQEVFQSLSISITNH